MKSLIGRPDLGGGASTILRELYVRWGPPGPTRTRPTRCNIIAKRIYCVKGCYYAYPMAGSRTWVAAELVYVFHELFANKKARGS